jgi:hypothetical protein
MRLFLATFL